MSRKGNCRDNAVAESFLSLLKTEQIKRRIFKTRGEARATGHENAPGDVSISGMVVQFPLGHYVRGDSVS